ncbi:aspartate/glutamate racemase family protein [soil metagenome]
MKHIGIVDVTTVGACICANEIVAEANRRNFADNHPEFTLHAFPFVRYKNSILNQEWGKVADLIVASIHKLKNAGADFAILPVNTIHYAIDEIIAHSPLPVLNLIEITVNECVRRKFKKVGILGTKLTMLNGLYTGKLLQQNIVPVIPDNRVCDKIQHLIMNEILAANIQPQTVASLAEDIKRLDCEAVILGCTELPEVYSEKILAIPAIDTTRLLAHKALEYANEP